MFLFLFLPEFGALPAGSFSCAVSKGPYRGPMLRVTQYLWLATSTRLYGPCRGSVELAQHFHNLEGRGRGKGEGEGLSLSLFLSLPPLLSKKYKVKVARKSSALYGPALPYGPYKEGPNAHGPYWGGSFP